MGFNRVPTAAARYAVQRRRDRLAEVLSNPMMALLDKAAGGPLSRELEQACKQPPQEVGMSTMQKVRDAYLSWDAEGTALERAVRRWRPDPRNPGKALDGSDLDQHPPEHRVRKLKEGQAAIRSHDVRAVTQVDQLILGAEKEPKVKFELGTRLGAAELGEVHLLVTEYRDLTKQQQAELQVVGLAALERGDLVTAIQHKRAAQTLHVQTPELDAALAEKDPVRQEGKAQLDVLRSLAEAAHAAIARRHVAAGIAEAGEQISHLDYAAQHGFDPEGSGSYVQAVVGGTGQA